MILNISNFSSSSESSESLTTTVIFSKWLSIALKLFLSASFILFMNVSASLISRTTGF